jgi:hypothetical protein
MLVVAALAAVGVVLPAVPAAAATTVGTAEELHNALQAGGDVVLAADITADAAVEAAAIPTGVAVVLDLNGFTLTATATDGLAARIMM